MAELTRQVIPIGSITPESIGAATEAQGALADSALQTVEVDGVTITGSGTVGDPLVAVGGGESGIQSVLTDGVTITGDGTTGNELKTGALMPNQIAAGVNITLNPLSDGVIEINAASGGEGEGGAGGILPVIAGGLALMSGEVGVGDAVFLREIGGKIYVQRASSDVNVAVSNPNAASAVVAQIVGADAWYCQFGQVDGYVGLTPGMNVFLRVPTTGVSNVGHMPPNGTGQFVQRVGTAISTTAISVEIGASRKILPVE